MKNSRLLRDSQKVKLRRSKKFGRGIYAVKPIRKGEFIAAFNGTVYDDDFEDWTEDLLNHAIQIGPALWRDSAGIARYVNHSCNPNCGIKDYVKIVAMRAIRAGEQITWDYEMTEKNPTWRMRCRCGFSDCRRVIGNYARMPERFRRRYKGYVSEWIVKAARKRRRLRRAR
jgi:SET domain-containing protein